MLTKAISPLLGSERCSCFLWGNFRHSWYLHSSRYPSPLGGVHVLHLGLLWWLSVRPWMLWQRGGDSQWAHGCYGRGEVTVSEAMDAVGLSVRPWMLWDSQWGHGCCGRGVHSFFPGETFPCLLRSRQIHPRWPQSAPEEIQNFGDSSWSCCPALLPFRHRSSSVSMVCRAGFKQEECGWQGGRKMRGMGCRNWQHFSPSSLSIDTHTT